MNHTTTPIRRLGVAVTGIVALAAGGVVVLGATASASALTDAGAHTPILTGEPGDPSPPPDLSLDDLLLSDDDDDDGPIVPTPLPLGDDSDYQGPIVTIPLVPGDDDDDGPIYQGPITSIPLVPGDDDDDDGPIYQGPLVSIPLLPQDDTPSDDPPDTTLPSTELPDTPATTTPTAPDSTPTDAPQPPNGPAQVAPFVRVTAASVECDGSVRITYETGAAPALAPLADHVVMISPASNPAAVMSQRLIGREVDGTFELDLQAPAAEGYHVFVVADFEPASVDGVILVDEADAPAPTNCPVEAG